MAGGQTSAVGRLAGAVGRRAPPGPTPVDPARGDPASGKDHSRTISGGGILMGKPLILISACTQERGAEFDDFSLSLSMHYPRAILAAGGLPWVTANQVERGYVAEAV